jgi:hypothetical protein
MKPSELAVPNPQGTDRLTFFACVVFGFMIFFAIVSGRCLYADGSYYLLRVLQAGNFTEMIHSRCFAAYLFQLPVVVAFKLGITNLHWLTLAFGVGCFSAWPVAMWLCYRMAPQHFWLVMLACALGYLNAAFMAVGEHIVAHAFFWPALFAVLFVRPLTPASAGVLLVSAGLLLRSYESLLFLGPPLAGLAVWRLVSGDDRRGPKVVLGLAAVLFICASGIALQAVLHPDSPANAGGFKRGVWLALVFPSWTLVMSYFWILLMLATNYPQVAQLLNRRAGFVVMGLAVLLWGAWPLLVPEQLNPADQYDSRFFNLLVPMLLLPLAVLMAVKPRWLAGQARSLARFSAAMLIAQSLWHLSATCQWRGYVHEWRKLLATQNGPILLADVYGVENSRNGQALRFDWDWANPTMGLFLGPSQVQALVMPEVLAGWQPFDPLKPKDLPDLHRYGLNYSRYVSALLKFNETNQNPNLRPLHE